MTALKTNGPSSAQRRAAAGGYSAIVSLDLFRDGSTPKCMVSNAESSLRRPRILPNIERRLRSPESHRLNRAKFPALRLPIVLSTPADVLIRLGPSEIRTGQLDIFRIARHAVTKDRFPQADSDEQREVGINPVDLQYSGITFAPAPCVRQKPLFAALPPV